MRELDIEREIERENVQIEDVWESKYVTGETIAYMIVHEERLNYWWSTWAEVGNWERYWNWWGNTNPGRVRVEMAYHYQKREIDAGQGF